MRNFIIAATMVAALGLGACASSGSQGADVLPVPTGRILIVKPDASIPAPYARSVGVWEGEGGFDTYTFIVRSVSPEGNVSCILFGHVPQPWHANFSGKIEGNTIHWTNPYTGSRYAFILNDDSVTLDRLPVSRAVLNRVPETAYPASINVVEPISIMRIN